MRFITFNARKSRAATADIISKSDWDILLLQEPYVTVANKVPFPNASYSDDAPTKVRAAIIARKARLKLIVKHTNADACVAAVEGANTWVASIYADIHKPSVHPCLQDLVDASCRKNVKLIIAADTNAHSVLWGSQETNGRGEEWEDFVLENELTIENVSPSLPTFENEQGHISHIDVTLTKGVNLVKGWKVWDGPMVSDHREIHFDAEITGGEKRTWNEKGFNLRKGDWKRYGEKLDALVHNIPRVIKRGRVEERAAELERLLHLALEGTVPRKKLLKHKPVPWWNGDLDEKRKTMNRAYRKYKRTLTEEDSAAYKVAHGTYKNAILLAKEQSWRDFCSNSNEATAASDLVRAVKRTGGSREAWVAGANGSEEHYQALMTYHFPGIQLGDQVEEGRENRIFARFIQFDERLTAVELKEILDSFGPYKAAGPDDIRPIMLQAMQKDALDFLSGIYRDSLSSGLIPERWREMKMAFIPKPGKDHSTPKGHRPITLSSFLLKGLEKALLRMVAAKGLTGHHGDQHAYSRGKGCDTVLLPTRTISSLPPTAKTQRPCERRRRRQLRRPWHGDVEKESILTLQKRK
jgi:hypothetical protein